VERCDACHNRHVTDELASEQILAIPPVAGLVDLRAAFTPDKLRHLDVTYNRLMEKIVSDGAEISYDVTGRGPAVVLLHPFPANHEFWVPLASGLASGYRLIMPDLRGHGESALGDGPATMQKHALDVARIMDAAGVSRVPMVGVSIGGYTMFEFWRRFRERIAALVLCNTKAQADTAEARNSRLQAADDVLQRGIEPFFESMVPKLLGETTRRSRPDLVEGAARMMRKMSPEDVAGVQRGMAERPDSLPTLKTINVPTLIITGDEDILTGVPDAELMKQHIPGSGLRVVAKAGHFSPWEQPEEVGKLIRNFLDRVH
jgi:3-oxoadipate enol-lactonase